MTRQTRRPEWLLQQASKASSDFGHITALAATVRDLCAQLAELHGDDATPQRGCLIEELPLGDSAAKVEFEYRAGYPSKISGPPENCYEGQDEEISVIQVLVNGTWIDADQFAQPVLDCWVQQISDQAAQNAEDRKHGEFE